MLKHITMGAILMLAHPSVADVNVRFIEGAPADRFEIEAVSTHCFDEEPLVTINLRGSQGDLIFDVTGAGAGVEVYRDVAFVSGADLVTWMLPVEDGHNVVSLRLSALPVGQVVAFVADLDDRADGRQTVITGPEMVGATAAIRAGESYVVAEFGADMTATIPWDVCIS